MDNSIFIKETNSTNSLMRDMLRSEQLPEGFVLHTEFQTAGKGQIGNAWESAVAENSLFSMVIYPNKIEPAEQFLISQLVSLGIKKTLDTFTDDITIKWPNDIYWKDKKIAGILIENVLQGKNIKFSIIGIGININQTEFVSNAPNPVSLKQITEKYQEITPIMDSIRQNILDLYKHLNKKEIREMYSTSLYRKTGIYTFNDGNEEFSASILEVHADGKLELETTEGEYRDYYFKEVSFVI